MVFLWIVFGHISYEVLWNDLIQYLLPELAISSVYISRGPNPILRQSIACSKDSLGQG